MWRHRATCSHCGLGSKWNQDREVSEQEILAHLKYKHNVTAPLVQDDYRVGGSANATFAFRHTWTTAPNAARIFATCTPGTSTACAAGVSEAAGGEGGLRAPEPDLINYFLPGKILARDEGRGA